MNMKKSLIAAAVASVCAVPMVAQADAEVWGEFVAGVESLNADARGNTDADGSLNVALDSADFGVESEEDLGNGLTVTAGTELAIGEDPYGDPDSITVGLDSTFGAISGDFGSVLLGWGVDSAYYLHVMEPVDRGEIYDTYSDLGSGDESSNAIQYGYDGGAFQLTAELVLQDTDEEDTALAGEGETENFDRMGIGATFDAGVVTVGVGFQSSSTVADDDTTTATTDESAEPTTTGVSVGGSFGGFDIGAAYQTFDKDSDVDDAEPSVIDVVASTDLGGGMGALLGVSSLDADTDDDAGNTTTINAQISQALSQQTYVFAQLQSQSKDGGDTGEDVDPQSIFLGINHAF